MGHLVLAVPRWRSRAPDITASRNYHSTRQRSQGKTRGGAGLGGPASGGTAKNGGRRPARPAVAPTSGPHGGPPYSPRTWTWRGLAASAFGRWTVSTPFL